MSFASKLVLALAALVGTASADIPAHCVRDQVVGKWTLSLGANDHSYKDLLDYDCLSGEWKHDDLVVTLDADGNEVHNEDGDTIGTWTTVYDQGIEITIPGQLPASNQTDIKAFFFFDYASNSTDNSVTSYCGRSLGPSYYHEVPIPGVAPERWGCLQATGPAGDAPSVVADHAPAGTGPGGTGLFLSRARRRDRARPVASPSVTDLPTSFSWLDTPGAVSPMRDQLSCGSCYAFAGSSILESAARIADGTPHFVSPQEIVSCSPYSQGCEGGFAYLVAKYSQDFGLRGEKDFPYTSGLMNEEVGDAACEDGAARPNQLYYAMNFGYVGGFYGNCSVGGMMQDLVHKGPIAVGIEVTEALEEYTCSGGTYVEPAEHKAAREAAGDFEVTNHAVVVVGYGTDDDGVDYWTVRNSWGRHFGNTGYFNIRRGTDELAIESMAFSAEVKYVKDH